MSTFGRWVPVSYCSTEHILDGGIKRIILKYYLTKIALIKLSSFRQIYKITVLSCKKFNIVVPEQDFMHVNNTSWEFPFYRTRNKLLLTWILPNASFGGMVQGIPMRKQIYCHVWLNNWIFWKKASDLLNLNYFLLMVYSTRVGESLVHWHRSI